MKGRLYKRVVRPVLMFSTWGLLTREEVRACGNENVTMDVCNYKEGHGGKLVNKTVT